MADRLIIVWQANSDNGTLIVSVDGVVLGTVRLRHGVWEATPSQPDYPLGHPGLRGGGALVGCRSRRTAAGVAAEEAGDT